jgi:uncharacterized protein YpiB (UPF0302 family)
MSEQNTDDKTSVVEVDEDDEDDFYNQFESFLSKAQTKKNVSTENVRLLNASNISNETPQNSSIDLADKVAEVSTASVEVELLMADIDKCLDEDDEEVVEVLLHQSGWIVHK